MRKYIILIFIFIPAVLFAQKDSLKQVIPKTDSVQANPLMRDTISQKIKENPYYIDSLGLIVKDIVISGNRVTKDEIILREMSLKPGSKFTLGQYEHDVNRIYNLGLFTKVDIFPLPGIGNQIVLDVDVQERWYILPLPNGGIEEGSWKKIWVGLNTKWENFRGRNETAGLNFRLFYNPSVNVYYSVPWIGKDLHLFSSINFGFSRIRNRSLETLGMNNGSETYRSDETNFDNNRFNGILTVGKFVLDRFSVFTEFGYNYLRVTQYAPNRTVSPTGKDRYFTLGLGLNYDSRNIREYTTEGYYLKIGLKKFGLIDNTINYERFQLLSSSFIPVGFAKDFSITLASKIFTSLAIGGDVPIYNHEYLGYSEDYIRGWQGFAFEGENALTMYNEIRIPIFKPRYIKAGKLPILKDIPVLKNFDLKHGLYFTILYDVGAVFNRNQSLHNVKFLSGTGIGLNFILPFGYVVRTEWDFRLGKPIVGRFGFSLEAKF